LNDNELGLLNPYPGSLTKEEGPNVEWFLILTGMIKKKIIAFEKWNR
jgi:hypothetical protein